LENQLVIQEIDEIKQLAVDLLKNTGDRPTPFPAVFFELNHLPRINLPLERPLWQPKSGTAFDGRSLEVEDSTLGATGTDLLSEVQFVDVNQLRANIAFALQTSASITLRELIQLYPVTKGAEELISYLAIASEAKGSKILDEATVDLTLKSDGADLHVTCPEAIFSKQEGALY
jgi:hypothetical protein